MDQNSVPETSHGFRKNSNTITFQDYLLGFFVVVVVVLFPVGELLIGRTGESETHKS